MVTSIYANTRIKFNTKRYPISSIYPHSHTERESSWEYHIKKKLFKIAKKYNDTPRKMIMKSYILTTISTIKLKREQTKKTNNQTFDSLNISVKNKAHIIADPEREPIRVHRESSV